MTNTSLFPPHHNHLQPFTNPHLIKFITKLIPAHPSLAFTALMALNALNTLTALIQAKSHQLSQNTISINQKSFPTATITKASPPQWQCQWICGNDNDNDTLEKQS